MGMLHAGTLTLKTPNKNKTTCILFTFPIVGKFTVTSLLWYLKYPSKPTLLITLETNEEAKLTLGS